ncbi:MAG: DUF7282 domain-containing protein [Halobacteriota archaeon]
MSTRKQLTVVFVALMVLCGGIAMVAGAAVASPTTVSVQDEANDSDSESANETDQPTASVAFSEQTTDGTQVTVDEVTLEEGGFVTIHDSSLLVGNVIGSVIGVSAYLEAGTHEDVVVELDQPLEESETLIAMPHLDTNENQTYDFVETEGEADGPYLTADGEPVIDDAQITLEEAADDEPADDEPADDEPADDEPTDDDEPVDDSPDEEDEHDDNDTVVMEPDPEVVEDGVSIVQPEQVFVTIENITIEELTVENAQVFVFVISDDADLDRLEEILGEELDGIDVETPGDEDDADDEDEVDDEDETDTDDEDDTDADDEDEDETDTDDEDETDTDDEDDTDADDEDDTDADDENGLDDEDDTDADDEDEVDDEDETDTDDEDDTDADDENGVDDEDDTDAGDENGVDDEDDTDTDDEDDTDADDEDQMDDDADAESFTVANLEAPDNVTVGENITVTATIGNPNDEEATQAIEFRLQGDLIDSQEVTVEGGAEETVTFEVDTTGLETGTYVHMVLSDDFGEVALLEVEPESDDSSEDETNDAADETDQRVPIGIAIR